MSRLLPWLLALLPLAALGNSEDAAFTLYLSGTDQGVIEPCGCTGGQLGGIGRRASLLQALTAGDAPRLILSTGGLPGGIGALQEIRYEIMLLCFQEMGYDAAGIGPEELALGLPRIAEARDLVEFPFLLTNVEFPDDDAPIDTDLVKDVAGYRVQVLCLLPESLQEDLPGNARFIPPAEAVARVQADVDFTVVLFRGSRSEAKALDLPEPNVVLYSHPHSEPQIHDFGKRDGPIKYLSPGDRGRFISHVKLSPGLVAFDAVHEPLELHYPESEAIRIYLDWYKERVIGEDVLAGMVEQRPAPEGAPYIGQGTCALCHEKAHQTWVESAHAHAYETLVKVDRDFDPECLSCHVVGFSEKTGFRNADQTSFLKDVGCESCHGPCSDHAASAGTVKTPLKVDCALCHNPDHSADFMESEFWPKIRCASDPSIDYMQKDRK